MIICNKCRGSRIKTRINKSFSKSYVTPISCKDCGSTDISLVKNKDFRSRRRRSGPIKRK